MLRTSWIGEKPFVLMADKSRAIHVSTSECMSVVLRYVDTGNEIHVYLMELIIFDRFDVKSLSDKLVEFLSELNVPVRNALYNAMMGMYT
jgi:hypothetical protein